jgi:hypothetical protein
MKQYPIVDGRIVAARNPAKPATPMAKTMR